MWFPDLLFVSWVTVGKLFRLECLYLLICKREIRLYTSKDLVLTCAP
jgi:hypothetical protein